MQVRIYAVRTEYGWHSGITVDWRIDVRYWLAGEGSLPRGSKLVVLHQQLPIQVGIAVLEHFMPSEAMERWGEQGWVRYFADILSPCVEEFEEEAKRRLMQEHLAVAIIEAPYSEPTSNLLVMEKQKPVYRVAERSVAYATTQWNAEPSGLPASLLGEGSVSQAEAHPVLHADAYRIAYGIRGRLLLDEELIQFLRDAGAEHLVSCRYSLIQWGLLRGWLELRAGMSYTRQDDGGKLPDGSRISSLRRVVRSLYKSSATICCGRCGSSEGLSSSSCSTCHSVQCWTCTQCLNVGRCRSCAILIAGKLHRGDDSAITLIPNREGQLEKWGLAPAQLEASRQALDYIDGVRTRNRAARQSEMKISGRKSTVQGTRGNLRKGAFLLWAVTGAGKTEMIFPLVEDTLLHSGRVLIATPRRDVVLELKPRIEKAFPAQKVVTLYGGSSERWGEGDITIATTHQLIRFEEAFELAIIDELDAFPYHNDPMLQRTAERACRPGGVFVYLSATPPDAMQRDVRRGKLSHARVPVRFHRHPLPIPMRITMPSVDQCLSAHGLPALLLARMNHSVRRGAQLFVFLSRIRQVDPLVRLLRERIPGVHIDGTSAADESRGDKVIQFRERNIRVLVTTTILERGVTVPMSDVFILDADDRLFDAASLVQMAGRAGRSKDDPAGLVVFGSPQWNRSQRSAVRQIRDMNRIAARKGYLLSGAVRRQRIG
ncbi:DEAD/DEAH box helicase family protein [Paenibacillus sp. MER 180]|uniref:helicase-related protein n=1 Tax=Paenibacillus sp. MER 180 TaxID=2939570 RepID=UPI00203CA4C3|nr:helicase-related protein [Paenibacillus sp. MER 180]MCM3288577.1 DEAD/DEAH box helicase family protein [Paenibacillus sp. MER 180]